MRWHYLMAAVLGAGLGLGRANAAGDGAPAGIGSGLIARIHFVGTDRIAADPNADELKGLGALPETAALREATLQKLAVAPYQFLKNRTANQDNHAALIRPLLDDLLRAETYVEVQDSTDKVPELMMAVRLGKDRAGVWQANLMELLASWTGITPGKIQSGGFDGWELKKHDDPNLVRFFRAGDWVVFGFGQDELHLQDGWMRLIKERQRPVEEAKNYWLDAWADWPRLAAHQLSPTAVKLPKMRLVVEGRKEGAEKEYVRPQLTMQFDKPLGLTLEAWRMPTNSIQNPLISFTAVRGLTAWLNDQPLVKEMNAAPLPNQLFLWGADQIPYPAGVIVPVRNATNYLQQIAPGLVAVLKATFASHLFRPEVAWTNSQVQIIGLPIFAPHLGAKHTAQGDYLAGGLMPEGAQRPLPPGLASEVMTHTNLVYYSWELTGASLKQWRSYTSLYGVISKSPPVSDELPAEKWIEAVWDKVGNCGTVVTMTGPNELTLVRNSPVGFTALELTYLAKWLDAPRFPWSMEYDMVPLALPVRGNLPPGAPNSVNPPIAPGAR